MHLYDPLELPNTIATFSQEEDDASLEVILLEYAQSCDLPAKSQNDSFNNSKSSYMEVQSLIEFQDLTDLDYKPSNTNHFYFQNLLPSDKTGKTNNNIKIMMMTKTMITMFTIKGHLKKIFHFSKPIVQKRLILNM